MSLVTHFGLNIVLYASKLQKKGFLFILPSKGGDDN